MKYILIFICFLNPVLLFSQSTYSIRSNTNLVVNGDINAVFNSGTIENDGSIYDTVGTFLFKGPINISGTGTTLLNNLTIDHANDTTILNQYVSILAQVTVIDGVLNSNNYLTLKSSATKTASIGPGNASGNYINGSVIVERYNTARRAFRFYGHPFNSSISLSELTDDIDITGNGGAANGFTNTQTNNPSAYWFDVATGDTSTTGNNPGWQAFTSATTSTWDRNELLRLLVRGAKGQGLTGGSYTPDSVTFEATGEVNQGTQVVTLAKGPNTNFVGCGNPFASAVQMQSLSKGSNIGANYYVWDATSGIAGAYLTNPFNLSYELPSFGAFFTTVSATDNITFEETDKVSGGASLFKTTSPENLVEIIILDSFTKWDRLLIKLDANSQDTEDALDGKKLYNPGLDFYTRSKDNIRLAVDVRPYTDGESIPLGLNAYNRYNNYVFKVGLFDVPVGTKLVLHDKYLNTKTELNAGAEYRFDVTPDISSQGEQRFEINMVGKPSYVSHMHSSNSHIGLSPNPSNSILNISFEPFNESTLIRLVNVHGKAIYKKLIKANVGKLSIDVSDLTNGVYFVEFIGVNRQETERFIKL